MEEDVYAVRVGATKKRLIFGYGAVFFLGNLALVLLFWGQIAGVGFAMLLLNGALLFTLYQDTPYRLQFSAGVLEEISYWKQREIHLVEVKEIKTGWVPFGTSNLSIIDCDGQRIDVPIIAPTVDLRHMLGKAITGQKPGFVLGVAEGRALGLRR